MLNRNRERRNKEDKMGKRFLILLYNMLQCSTIYFFGDKLLASLFICFFLSTTSLFQMIQVLKINDEEKHRVKNLVFLIHILTKITT